MHLKNIYRNSHFFVKIKPILIGPLFLACLNEACGDALKNSRGMNDKDLWVNVTRTETYDRPSIIGFFNENTSNSSVSLVGCNNDKNNFVQVNLLKNITPHSYSPMTNTYDSKWKFLDDGTGIYDKDYLKDSYLRYAHTPKNDNLLKCFYKVEIFGTKDPLFFKMEVNNYNFTAMSPFSKMEDTDPAKTAEYAYSAGKTLWPMVPSGVIGLSAFATPWSLYKNRWERTNDASIFLNKEVESLFGEYLKRATFEASITNPYIANSFAAIRKLLMIPPGRYTDRDVRLALRRFSVDGKIDKISKFEMITSAYGYDLGLRTESGKLINVRTEFKTVKSQFEWLPIDIDGESFAIRGAENITITKGINAIDKTAVAEISTSYFDREIEMLGVGEIKAPLKRIGNNLLKEVGENRTTKALMKLGYTKAGLKELGIVGTSANVALIALPFIINGFYHDYPFGNYETSVGHLRLDAPNESEVDEWNKLHLDNKIMANTKSTPPSINKDDNGNTSLMHTATFTYKDINDTDTQTGIVVSLNALSTPFVRLDPTNGKPPEDDPYLGDIKLKYGAESPYSAAVLMTISDINNGDISKDITYQATLIQMQSMGVNELAIDDRYEAPAVLIDKVLNTKKSRENKDNKKNMLTFKSGQKDGLLTVSKNGLMKYGKFEGIFLNDNQDLQLKTSLINPYQISANQQGKLLGGGFSVLYRANDDDSSNSFIPVKSVSLRNELDSINDNSQPQYLYNRFKCLYPTPVGEPCDLELAIGGIHDNKKHQGTLYISDAASKTGTIPVYLNYHLLSEPKDVRITQSGIGYPSTFTLRMQNASSDDYVKVEVSGLPEGVKIKNNSDGSTNCTKGIKSGEYCTITYDISQVAAEIVGSFDITITGLTAKLLPIYQKMVKNQMLNTKSDKNTSNNSYKINKNNKLNNEFIDNNSADVESLFLDIMPGF